MNTQKRLPDFVLVHGAFSDSSVWAKIVDPPEAAGAKVTALDLPSHTVAGNVRAGQTTLADHVAAARRAVDAAAEPVILVGHSLNGMTITQVAVRGSFYGKCGSHADDVGDARYGRRSTRGASTRTGVGLEARQGEP